jgi:hypothetical protein
VPRTFPISSDMENVVSLFPAFLSFMVMIFISRSS